MRKGKKLFLFGIIGVIIAGVAIFVFAQMGESQGAGERSRPLTMVEKILQKDDVLDAYMEENFEVDEDYGITEEDVEEARENLFKLKERYPYFSYEALDEFYNDIRSEVEDESYKEVVLGKVSWNVEEAYEDEELNQCVAEALETASKEELKFDPELKRLRKRLYFMKQHYPDESYEALKEKMDNMGSLDNVWDEFSLEENYIILWVNMDEELMEYVDSLIPNADPEELKQDPNLDDLRKFLYIQHHRHEYLSYEELTEDIYTEGKKFRSVLELTNEEQESYKAALAEKGLSSADLN